VVTVVADKLKRQWFGGFTLVFETNCIRQLERNWLKFSQKAGSDFLRRLTTTIPDILTTK